MGVGVVGHRCRGHAVGVEATKWLEQNGLLRS